jgi:hypothetical protein
VALLNGDDGDDVKKYEKYKNKKKIISPLIYALRSSKTFLYKK